MTTGTCPLSCRYCYIPKSKEMINIHKKIEEDITTGKYIERLHSMYGKDLTHLAFWGTEPILTLSLITKEMPKILKEFPKLRASSFSTSMMLDPKPIADFICEVGKDRNYKVEVQVSLDGPDFVTDVNRIGGATNKIIDNLLKLCKHLNEMDTGKTKIEIRWKSTIDTNNMDYMLREGKIKDFFKFWEDTNIIIKNAIKNKNIFFAIGSFVPTLAVPGKYTVNDGKIFTEFLKECHRLNYSSTYTYRLEKIFDRSNQNIPRRQYTCSGGNSNFGIGERMHICHRTFYLDEQKYIDSVLSQNSSIGDAENWDVSIFNKESLGNLKKNFIVDINNSAEMDRFIYVMRGYHDFWKLQVNSTIAILKELAVANQASKIYKYDDNLCILFAIFVNTGLACPMENLLNTGSVHVSPVSLIRLFANGAFEELVKQIELSRREQ